MIETVFIVTASLALLVYWFRYTVVLLLNEEQPEKYGHVIGQLSVLETSEALRQGGYDLPLDPLRRALEQDYRMLRYLIDHAAGMGLHSFEQYALFLDYRIMKLWYRFTRNRRALVEMAGILSHIAYKMGAHAAGFSHA